jgi:hypothetical protein
MALKEKDDYYLDGKDQWVIHYITSEDTRINPGDYKEVVQFLKNGVQVGQTTWHKDKNGKDRSKPYEEGIQLVPPSAKRVDKKKK